MAKLMHFEQDPDAPEGAGVFHFDSGAKQYAYEPQLAAQIGQVKGALDAAPDLREARNGAPAPGPKLLSPADLSARASARMVADTNAQLNPQGIVDNANAAVGHALASAAPNQVPPPGIAAPGPPPSPQELGQQARDVMGNRAAEEIIRGTHRTFHQGAPGVDPHKLINNGVMVPTTGAETFESDNALPYSPEAAQERLGASRMVQQADLADMELNRQQTQNQLNSQRALAPKLAAAANAAQENQNRVISAYRTDRSRLQQDLDHYEKTAHVNPDRFFQDRGVFATIGMAIAQGLGAYASTMTGAPNFAYEMVQKAIDRDISAQRDEIEAGRTSRRNTMAQMMDNYGFDMQQAEAAARLAMGKSADMQAQMFANESKLPHYQTEAAKYLALNHQENIKNEQAFQAASIGKHTRTINNAFLQPKAASGPGFTETPLTAEQAAADAKNLPKGTGTDYQDLKPEDRLKTVESYGTKKQDFADSRSAMSDLADAYGLTVDWKTGALHDKATGKAVNADDFTITGSHEDIPGVGRPSLNFQGSKRVREARALVEAQTGKALSGSSVSPVQGELIKSYALGNDDASAVRGLARSAAALNNIERDTESSFPEEARAEYARRAQGVNRTRKAAPAPVRVSEY